MASLLVLERLFFVHMTPVRTLWEDASGRHALRAAALRATALRVTALRSTTLRAIVLGAAALICAWLIPATATAAARERGLPPNLHAPADIERHLERLLQVSPTFRRQCDLIRRTPRVRITIGYGMRRSSLIDAETVVQKHEYGSIVVTTTLYLPGDLTELIVHELEHVCEQIEGVALEALSQTRPDEAHEFLGRYETKRARLAGRRAVKEAYEFQARMPPATRLASVSDDASAPASTPPGPAATGASQAVRPFSGPGSAALAPR